MTQPSEIKYKIKATNQQLDNFGICYEISGLTGILKHKYPTGWYELEVTHTYDGNTFTNNFDIPHTFLEEIVDTEDDKSD